MINQSNLLFAAINKIVMEKTEQVALLDLNGRTVTYQQLIDQVEHAQAWFNAIGLKPGDTLIALLPNSIETIILFLASMRGGFTYAPLPCTATIAEIKRWKNCVHANFCLLANPVSASTEQQIKMLDWKAEVIDITNGLCLQRQNIMPAEKTGLLVMQSSGSTGEPKAILLSGDRLWESAKAFIRFHNCEDKSLRFWNFLPMSYLGGLFNLTLIPLVSGGSILVDDAFSGKTFLGFWSVVERYQINCLWLVPTVLRGLLTLSKRIGQVRLYPKIEYCFLGTAPILLEEKQDFFDTFGIMPLENYGLSETTFISSEYINEIAKRSEGSVGKIMPDVQIELRTHENGAAEIWVKTPYCMLGYLNENGLIEHHLDAQGFMSTGDYGQIVNKQLVIVGRRRDIIKKGGVLILLREIEQIVNLYPGVIEAAAVKINHPFYGESYNLHLCVSDAHDSTLKKEITPWIHEQLSKDKWPEHIFFHRTFPKTPSGKVQKHLLVTGKAYAESNAN